MTNIDTIREGLERIVAYGASKFKGDYTSAQLAKNAIAAIAAIDPEISKDATELVLKIREFEENEGIIIWPAFAISRDDASALITAHDNAIRRECTSFAEIKDWLIGKSSEYKSEYIQAAIVILREMFKERAAIIGKEAEK